MLLRISTNLVSVFLALLVIVAANEARAQVFDFEHSHPNSMTLDGPLRFHLGDDPDGKLGWADPAFDDSQWTLLRSNLTWSEQGYADHSGFAWYRFKVVVPPHSEHLGILIPQLRTSYEIFADGKFVGQFGGMPPKDRYVIGFDQIFPLSPAGSSSGHAILIAIRVWEMDWFAQFGGGLNGAPTIGEMDALKSLKAQNDWGRFWSISAGNALMLMNLVAAFAGFFLFSIRSADREYLWFGLYELLTGVQHLCTDWVTFYPTGWKTDWLLDDFLATASWLFFLVFLFRILNGRRNWLFWATVGTEVATVAGTAASLAGWISWDQWRIAAALFLIPYFSCILALLYRRARQSVADAQVMIAPVAVCYVTWFATIVLVILKARGQTWVGRDFGWLFELSAWPFPFSFLDLADMLMLLAVLAVLPLRFARSRRDEERMAAEMESARTVQQVLIPTEIPAVPGFDIQCIYKPAGHVGGDFFQIIPIACGGLLIVIGDVSGKGMPAAMTVSLLVGTIRTLAHFTDSPTEILDAMNQRMLTRSQGGFTTCLVLRAAPNYTLTVANAGHIAPYLQGAEVEISNGLPLGLAKESAYPEASLTLPENARLTLVTDGVVEARTRAGELFGFERTASLSTQAAETIACTAQDFGQEDDITVLTLSRSPREAETSREVKVGKSVSLRSDEPVF
jgi:Stage II sporulation protein E (SpoIIE)/7TM diverse intracellular signalling